MTTKHNKAAEFYDSVDQMTETGATVMDAIIEFCTKNTLEIESVVPLVTRNAPMMSRLREEAERLHFIKSQGSSLPI